MVHQICLDFLASPPNKLLLSLLRQILKLHKFSHIKYSNLEPLLQAQVKNLFTERSSISLPHVCMASGAGAKQSCLYISYQRYLITLGNYINHAVISFYLYFTYNLYIIISVSIILFDSLYIRSGKSVQGFR